MNIKVNLFDEGVYISGIHCRRAIKHLNDQLVESGHFEGIFESSMLFEMWTEALIHTTREDESSPIGPSPLLKKVIHYLQSQRQNF
jgi:hypothetical protein